VYLAYRVTSAPSPDVLERLSRLGRRPGVRRVVVDVRLNGGGNNGTYGELLDVLAQPAISRKLVLLTGRQTFSAAGNFVADVARATRAKIVGELAGGAPSQWGDATELTFPLVGLVVRVATVYHDYGPASAVRPDVEVEPTAAQFLAGQDPVLEAAIR
jgi:C-terminal processing protease CtpA/Prc